MNKENNTLRESIHFSNNDIQTMISQASFLRSINLKEKKIYSVDKRILEVVR